MENPGKLVGGGLVVLCLMGTFLVKNIDSCNVKMAARALENVSPKPAIKHTKDRSVIDVPPGIVSNSDPFNDNKPSDFPHGIPRGIIRPIELDENWSVNALDVGEDEQVLVKNTATGRFRLYQGGRYEQGTLSMLSTRKTRILQLVNPDNFSDEDVNFLSEKGIVFAMDKRYYDEIKSNDKQVRVIYIISKDNVKIRELLNINEGQLEQAKQLFQPIYDNPHIVEVESLRSLEDELSTATKDGYMPVVVFNNNDNMIFGKPTASFDVPFITCNSYRFKNNGRLISFDNLTIKYINGSINKILQENPQPTQLNFMRSLAENYNRFEAEGTQNKYLFMAVVGTIGIGGVTLIINYNNKNHGAR